ncbi:unnamed protein product [Cuscuta campestris]|uniref:Uncharacterized protein n=1 Tax=Cuscuta campestris TaxID=132261 RepID=A0A484MLY1_9ASTE|nr:unnamed protein product [Cuscuta campestris]
MASLVLLICELIKHESLDNLLSSSSSSFTKSCAAMVPAAAAGKSKESMGAAKEGEDEVEISIIMPKICVDLLWP